MSAVFKSGPITFDAAENIEKFRLVTVTADGAKHATATDAVFGAVVTSAAPNASPNHREQRSAHWQARQRCRTCRPGCRPG